MDVGYEEMVWQMDVLHLLHVESIDFFVYVNVNVHVREVGD